MPKLRDLKSGKFLASSKAEIICATCHQSFSVKESRKKIAKFCSRSCLGKVTGKYSFLGRKHNKETRRKISLAGIGRKNSPETIEKRVSQFRGSKSVEWKGQAVGYRALHKWVEKLRGKAFFCEDCGRTESPKGKDARRNYFQWANISHHYLRILEDWKQLCYKCHKQFDMAHRKAST